MFLKVCLVITRPLQLPAQCLSQGLFVDNWVFSVFRAFVWQPSSKEALGCCPNRVPFFFRRFEPELLETLMSALRGRIWTLIFRHLWQEESASWLRRHLSEASDFLPFFFLSRFSSGNSVFWSHASFSEGCFTSPSSSSNFSVPPAASLSSISLGFHLSKCCFPLRVGQYLAPECLRSQPQ